MYWNYKRKSTKGWSIFNILLDMTGGILSFTQMLIEYLYGEDVDFNAVKVILGLAAVTYDIIFIIQHYCLYPESKQKQY
jgi:cystinosin